MANKTCRVAILSDGRMTIDLGGGFNGSCCGCPAAALSAELAAYGIELELKTVRCRLPVAQQEQAKKDGHCIAQPHQLLTASS